MNGLVDSSPNASIVTEENYHYMIYKNIEVFNTVEAEEYEGGMRFYRVPKAVAEKMEIPRSGSELATNSTGVELRFVVNSGYDDYEKTGKSEKWRRIIASECDRINSGNGVYVNGLELLGSMDLISADFVHPNIYGVNSIAEKLTKIVRESL